MNVLDCNLKEFNYCLRYHTEDTLRKFNLKGFNVRLGNPYDNCHDAWAGLMPVRGIDYNYVEKDALGLWIGVMIMKDYGV